MKPLKPLEKIISRPKINSLLDILERMFEIFFWVCLGIGLLVCLDVFAVMRRGTHSLPIISPTSSNPTIGVGGAGSDAILLENNVDYLLLEDGSKILLE